MIIKEEVEGKEELMVYFELLNYLYITIEYKKTIPFSSSVESPIIWIRMERIIDSSIITIVQWEAIKSMIIWEFSREIPKASHNEPSVTFSHNEMIYNIIFNVITVTRWSFNVKSVKNKGKTPASTRNNKKSNKTYM